MHDNCNPDSCPVNVRVEELKGRFDSFERESKLFHEKIENRVKEQETLAAVQKEKLESIDGKLDKLISWREEQDNKPNRLIDHLKENAINYIMLAMLGFMLLKMGVGA